jgi:microcystin-dependent protein
MRRMLLVLAALAGFSLPAQAQQFYLSQIIELGANFCPIGFAPTNGQILSIQQNTALFSLLGTSYGGDGISTFALPHLVPPLTVSRQPTILCIALQGIYPSHP